MEHWLVYQSLFFFLLVAAAGQNGDGSTPEEICPCQSEDTCLDDRHIFGRDPLDIQNFGLLSPCRNFGEFPCCPRDPPPPKEIKLTPQDFQGFSQEELAQLGIMNEGTIGTSSLPLAQQQQFSKFNQEKQQPIDITQPGAASIAPAGASSPQLVGKQEASTKEIPKAAKQQVYPVRQPPKAQYYRPVYQPPPVYRQPYVYPVMYAVPPYAAPMYRPVAPAYNYVPMYRPAPPYRKY